MTTNIQIQKSVDDLSEDVKAINKALVGDYDLDGYKGVIPELRDMRRSMDESPSFLKLFKDKPTILAGCIVGGIAIWLILYTLVSVPTVHGWLMAIFNIPIL